ncbi:MAG TPA: N-acetylmuramoyl-L-alanine amidase [Steroidobacteraceae bacterium]|nr:N-acetylmuramoyl-L-alanine amidase [Steroidobacteraceae bacterium]
MYRIHRWAWILGLFAGSPLAFARDAPPARLESIGLQGDERGALLTLSLSAPVAQHLFRLHNPERLVIDLPATTRRAKLPPPSGSGPVVSIRSGRKGEQLRLVVELRKPTAAHLQPSLVAERYRLQIAFGHVLPAAPALAAAPKASVPRSAVASAAAPASATPAAAIRAAHAPQGERDIIIAVDAGHGGDDPGATGMTGTHEKDVTLAIARALAERIDREPGMHAALTRNGDYFVALPNRIARARAAHSDMFVSIHADAIRDREVSGASVYILSERGASSEAARLLADQENSADLKGGISLHEQRPDVRSVLLDLSQNAAIGQSVEAADRVLGALDRVGAVRKHEVQQAAFVVLKSPDIPSMLVETAYISNPLEERKLRTPVEQERLADAIFSGIDSYFRKFPPEGSLYAHASEHLAGDTGLARGGF